MSSRTPIAGSPDDGGSTAELSREALFGAAEEAERVPHRSSTPLVSGRVLYVASTGGHLTELNRLATRFDEQPGSAWVTFDAEQSRSMLEGRTVHLVPYVAPRDVLGTLRAFRRILAIMRRDRFDVVVSTGAAVALAAFLAARLLRVRAVYIESIARVSGPSRTGRITAALRLATVRTQHASWASRRWPAHESVLRDFRPVPSPEPAPASMRVFVTLGTIRPYRFDALVDAVLRTGLAGEDTVWQLGVTTRHDLPGRVAEQLTHEEFLATASAADVVITHAGVGTILEMLERGVHPVVVPRSAGRQEHVDDHQHQIADYLRTLDVATVLDVEDLTAEHVAAAATVRTLALAGDPAQDGGEARPGVLLLTSDFPVGGLERIVVGLAGELASRGYPVGIVANAGGDMWAQVPPGIERVALGGHGPLGRAAALRRLRALATSGRYRVFHAHQRGIAALARIATAGTPCVVVEHVHNVFEPTAAARAASFRSPILVACAPEVGRMLVEDFRRPASRVHVVVNGVADQARGDAPERQEGRPLHLVGAGRMTPQKDPIRFVQTVAALAARRPTGSVRATWLGDGELMPAVRLERARLDLEDVLDLPGLVDDPSTVFADADCLLLTSRHEGLPLVALEMLSLGHGAVLPDVGGCADAIDERTGLLYDPELSVDGLADLLDRTLIPSVLERWAGAARGRYESRFTFDRMAEQVVEVYDVALAGGRSRIAGRRRSARWS